MKKTLLLLTAAVGLFATSCQKSDTKKETPSTAAQLVGTWKITYYKSFDYNNGVLVKESDLLLAMDSCKRDNLVDLRADATMYRDAGTLKCYTNQPQTFLAGTWQLGTDTLRQTSLVTLLDTTISGRIGGVSPAFPISPLTILELSGNRLKLYLDATTVVDGNSQSSKTLLVLEK